MRLLAVLALGLAISGYFLWSCSSTTRESGTRTSPPGEDLVLRERLDKDRDFKSGGDSPIMPGDRARFQGLAYFDITPSLNFHVKLNRYAAPQGVRLGTNTGEIRPALRYGYFEFQVDGRPCRLQVYRVEDTNSSSSGPSLFVPFRDATSGKETYASGRYIDLRENTTGYYELDFNRAYNPYCAYGTGFSCPVPPAENTLAVPIRAGEKKYPLAKEPAGWGSRRGRIVRKYKLSITSSLSLYPVTYEWNRDRFPRVPWRFLAFFESWRLVFNSSTQKLLERQESLRSRLMRCHP